MYSDSGNGRMSVEWRLAKTVQEVDLCRMVVDGIHVTRVRHQSWLSHVVRVGH